MVRGVAGTISNISLTTVWVRDIDESQASYVDELGFEERDDVRLGDDFRWCTVGHPSQPEIDVHLATPGPPLAPDHVDALTRVDALIRDDTGNWLVLVEPRELTHDEMEAYAGHDPASMNPLS